MGSAVLRPKIGSGPLSVPVRGRNFPPEDNVSGSKECFHMNGILCYPETEPHDVGLFEFLLEEVALDITLDLVMGLLEAFLVP